MTLEGRRRILTLMMLLAFGRASTPNGPMPIEGNPNAPVRVVVYQYLACPACARAHSGLEATVIGKYGGEAGFELRDFPLPMHPWAFNAAVIARLFDAHSLNAGLAWRDYCFQHQGFINSRNLLSVAQEWGKGHGIEPVEVTRAITDRGLRDLVTADINRGKLEHIRMTPTIELNGIEFRSLAALRVALDQALTRRLPIR